MVKRNYADKHSPVGMKSRRFPNYDACQMTQVTEERPNAFAAKNRCFMPGLFWTFCRFAVVFCCLGVLPPAMAEVRVGPWKPLFQGVEHMAGASDAAEARLQQVRGIRIQLNAPGLRFFSTPQAGSAETIGQTASDFLQEHHLQVAVNANFFDKVKDQAVPLDLLGLSISDGRVVSPPAPGYPALCLTAGNRASFVLDTPAKFLTTGIHTAVAGGRPLLTAGKNVGGKYGPSVHPRTAVGLTKDHQTMIWLVIDGRQPGYSLGATDAETGDWLLRLGAHDALMLDGGGSTALVYADSQGKPVVLNRPIHGLIPGRQRYNGNHLGLYARKLDDKAPPKK